MNDPAVDMALRIEKAFGVKMDTLLKMQTAWEIAEARKAAGGGLEVLRGGVPLHAEAAASRAAFEVRSRSPSPCGRCGQPPPGQWRRHTSRWRWIVSNAV